MIIIIEGPDASGKSTLAEYLASALDFKIQPSEGRPKYSGEFRERLTRYSQMDDVIFDRHPVISQVVYGRARASTEDMPTGEDIRDLYAKNPFIIYARASDLTHHKVKAHDTPDHLDTIKVKSAFILDSYDSWAVLKAHYIYRIGEPFNHLPSFIWSWFNAR
jgi:hypothetical protein